MQGMQPHPLAKLIRFEKIWENRFGQNQNLASPKHTIFYGYALCVK